MYSSSPLPHNPLLFPHTSHCNSEAARLAKAASNVLHLASLHSPVPLQGQAPQGGSRVFLISSESGSIGLRHAKEGGGNYAHHASKAALNMVGKLLSLDL